MSRPLFAAFAVVVAAGVAVWVERSSPTVSNKPSVAEPPISMTPSPPVDITSARVTVGRSVPTLPADDEPSLMARLRQANPATMLALARDGNRRYPGSPEAEEREARAIDALVALDDIGEAHTEAMLFVQNHPNGPFTTHIANLMGVRPRPTGGVPQPQPTAGSESERR